MAEHGIDTAFGVLGHGNLHIIDAWAREQGGHYVAAANEAGAVQMALGHAGITGKIGVATVSHGPALTNTVTSLVEAVKGRTPLLLIAGDTAAADAGSQQDVDEKAVVTAAGARFVQIRTAQTALADFATAVREAQTFSTPVVLNVPFDLLWTDVDHVDVRTPLTECAPEPERGRLEAAASLLASARRPIILGGRGAAAAETREAVTALAERTGAVLMTTLLGTGLFGDHPAHLGVFGTLSSPAASDMIARSDCIVAFGAALSTHTTGHNALLSGKSVVHVDTDPTAFGRASRFDVALLSDAGVAARRLCELLDELEVPATRFATTVDPGLSRHRIDIPSVPADRSGLELVSTMSWINDLLPTERTVVFDGGRFAFYALTLVPPPDPERFVFGLHFGSIGMGVSHAIGAAVAAPDRPTLLICGDGGFMLGGLAEFNTAVRQNLDLVVALFDDGAYGMEHLDLVGRDMDPGITEFAWPDFAEVARSLGGAAVTAHTTDDLPAVRKAVESRRGPILIDLKFDPRPIPLP
jgi:thiamine pyrophosphate-dependent acetolactate synthase large subunit-like protein